MNIRTESHGERLLIKGLDQLSAANTAYFKSVALAQLGEAHTIVEVDLSKARFMDSTALGALISILKRLSPRQGRVRLLHPQPMVHDMLKLLRMDQVFDIVTN